MGKELKKVIVLKNIYSNLFEEVILVLKPKALPQANNVNLVHEAKEIVENYVNKFDHYNTQPESENIIFEGEVLKKNKRVNMILNISLIFSIVLFFLLITKLF